VYAIIKLGLFMTLTVSIPRDVEGVMRLFIEAGVVKSEEEFIRVSAVEYVRSVIRRYQELCSSLEGRYGGFHRLEKELRRRGFGDTLEEHRKYDDYRLWKELRDAVKEYERICAQLEGSKV